MLAHAVWTKMRRAWVCMLVALLCSLSTAQAQVGFDRPGGDYSNFVIRSGDPAACAARCDRDPRCKAWSFNYPATYSARAMCWLKSTVPARAENACCASGVRGGGVIEPKLNGAEFGMDRYGGDYRHFELTPSPSGDACSKACEGEPRCRAWTYVRPGYGVASARCYLKARVTPPRRRPCCISGVIR